MKKEANTHQNHEPTLLKKWTTAIATLFVLSLLSMMLVGGLYMTLFGEKVPFGNVAVIKITGVITTEKEKGAFSAPGASADEIVKFLKDAQKDDSIKAVMLEINSPGGSAVASSEIADEVKRTREKKPVISVIREVGASGGYWIASSTEKIYANPMAATGSIGVISSYLEFAGLMDKYNVTYQRLVYGKYKDAGSPYRRLTEEERKIIEKQLETVGEAFVKVVSENRKLPYDSVKKYATGMAFLGSEAKEMGLIDELGSKAEAVKYLELKLNTTVTLTEYKKVPTLVEVISGAAASKWPTPSIQSIPNMVGSQYEIQAISPGDPAFYT